MIKKIYLYLFIFIFSFACLSATSFVYADGENTGKSIVSLSNPLGAGATPQSVIGNVISQVLGVVGALALIIFIYGGLTWMMAMGNEQQIKKGKDILVWATLGLVIIFSSYALVKFVLQAIGA